MLRRFLTVSLVLFALLSPKASLALEMPAVYIGSHGQAAIAFTSKYGMESSEEVNIQEVWTLPDGTLCFAIASASDHVYSWHIGDAQVSIMSRNELPRSAEMVLPPIAIKQPSFSSILKNITWIAPLSESHLAMISPEEGISIMNITLPQTTLFLDSWNVDLSSLCFYFQMANPDIRLEESHEKRYINGENADFNYSRIPLEEFIPEHPGTTDIYVAEIREAKRAGQAGVLADLSSSTRLREIAIQRLPAFQEYCSVYSVPYLLEVMTWWVDAKEWVKTDESFPQNVDELFLLYDHLLERYEKNEFAKYGLRGLFDENYVLASSLMSQYVMQYASVGKPLSFETPIFRNMMVGLRSRYDHEREIEAGLPDLVDYHENEVIDEACKYDRTPFASDDRTPLPPLSIVEGQDSYYYATAEVLVVDKHTTSLVEALRFLEFVSDVRSFNITLLYDFDMLSKLPTSTTIDFYTTEVFPKLKFHDADIYFDPVAGLDYCNYYSPSDMLYSYLDGQRDDIDNILYELTMMASKRYSEFFDE